MRRDDGRGDDGRDTGNDGVSCAHHVVLRIPSRHSRGHCVIPTPITSFPRQTKWNLRGCRMTRRR